MRQKLKYCDKGAPVLPVLLSIAVYLFLSTSVTLQITSLPNNSNLVYGLNVLFKKVTHLGPGRYPEYKDGTNVFRSTPEILRKSDRKARMRRQYVKNAMIHAWDGYKKYAWGYDELLPISKKGQNNMGGMGTTLVDALDTLWLMDMKKEFWEARDWVKNNLTHSGVGDVSVFETSIRSLGGLLSAYDLSGDKIFLEKAEDLGRRLGRAFNNPMGIATPTIELGLNQSETRRHSSLTSIAEAGTLQLEFHVSQYTETR